MSKDNSPSSNEGTTWTQVSPMVEVLGAPFSEYVQPGVCNVLAIADNETAHQMEQSELYERMTRCAKWAEVLGYADDGTLGDVSIGVLSQSDDLHLETFPPAGGEISRLVDYLSSPMSDIEHTPREGPVFTPAEKTFRPFFDDGALLDPGQREYEQLPDVVTDVVEEPSEVGFGTMLMHRRKVALLWADIVVDLTPDVQMLHPDLESDAPSVAPGMDEYDRTVSDRYVPHSFYLQRATSYRQDVQFAADEEIIYDQDAPDFDLYAKHFEPHPDEQVVAPCRASRRTEARRAQIGNRPDEPHTAPDTPGVTSIDPEEHPGTHALAQRDNTEVHDGDEYIGGRDTEPPSYDEPGQPNSPTMGEEF